MALSCLLEQTYVLQGPFRTRIIPYLRLGCGKHLVELLTVLGDLDGLQEDAVSGRFFIIKLFYHLCWRTVVARDLQLLQLQLMKPEDSATTAV
jgi:hypothetical protein